MKNDRSSNRVQQEPHKQPSAIPIPPDMPQGKETNCECNKGENTDITHLEKRLTKDERWMLIFTGIMAFSSAITVIVAFLQWDSMRRQLAEMQGSGKQTDLLIQEVTQQAMAANRLAIVANSSLAESKAQFQRDQRPYIIPTIEPFPVHPPGAPLQAKYFLVNYGKSPAMKVSGYAAILIGRDALKQADEWFTADINQRFNTQIGTMIPQGIPNGLNKDKYAYIPSKKVVSVEDAEMMNKIDNSVVIVMRHVYFDSAGNRHGTDSCYAMLKTWEASFCNNHNEIY
jgi:hypothetical protein